uniref:Uncharacterized protein n=1 Tax=Rhizophagus irregularis (strain DAOM 181602 / DAOM 197198 / MUCL 43194) TaxID=747089 RepID=U9SUG5_RHIID
MSHGNGRSALNFRFRIGEDVSARLWTSVLGCFRPKLWLWTSEGDVSGSRLRLETLEW